MTSGLVHYASDPRSTPSEVQPELDSSPLGMIRVEHWSSCLAVRLGDRQQS